MGEFDDNKNEMLRFTDMCALFRWKDDSIPPNDQTARLPYGTSARSFKQLYRSWEYEDDEAYRYFNSQLFPHYVQKEVS